MCQNISKYVKKSRPYIAPRGWKSFRCCFLFNFFHVFTVAEACALIFFSLALDVLQGAHRGEAGRLVKYLTGKNQYWKRELHFFPQVRYSQQHLDKIQGCPSWLTFCARLWTLLFSKKVSVLIIKMLHLYWFLRPPLFSLNKRKKAQLF